MNLNSFKFYLLLVCLLNIILYICGNKYSSIDSLLDYSNLLSSTTNKDKSNNKYINKSKKQSLHKLQSKLSTILRIKGGQNAINFNLNDMINSDKNKLNDINVKFSGPCNILVSTSYGSDFLDKKKKLVVSKNDTILDLKLQLHQKFPGSPPIQLQKLYFSNRFLEDHEVLGNISMLSPVPILLDMMTGTSIYNKTLSVTQALNAYVSTIVQQAYIGSKLQSLTSLESENQSLSSNVMDTIYFRKLIHQINESIYERYHDDILYALAQEQEPEVVASDTEAWRNKNNKHMNPLAIAIAKEFDLNWRGFKHFIYYSIVLAIFAYFGTTTSSSTKILLCMIPFLWISKLRQLRLLSKIVLYISLPIMAKLDFLLPLLPAPLQVIALQSLEWITSTTNNNIDKKIKDNEIIIETSKWTKKMKSKVEQLKKKDLSEKFKQSQKDILDDNDIDDMDDDNVEDDVEENDIISNEGEDMNDNNNDIDLDNEDTNNDINIDIEDDNANIDIDIEDDIDSDINQVDEVQEGDDDELDDDSE